MYSLNLILFLVCVSQLTKKYAIKLVLLNFHSLEIVSSHISDANCHEI